MRADLEDRIQSVVASIGWTIPVDRELESGMRAGQGPGFQCALDHPPTGRKRDPRCSGCRERSP